MPQKTEHITIDDKKLFEVTNDESLLSGVYFSPEFLGKREQWRKVRSGGKKPSKKAEKGYKTIEGSLVVKSGFNVQNDKK